MDQDKEKLRNPDGTIPEGDHSEMNIGNITTQAMPKIPLGEHNTDEINL